MSSGAPTTVGPAISPPTSRRYPRPLDAALLAALASLYVLACATFFNNYAFDDSYVGYSVAQSWLGGHGFTFNSNARVLSTSAPLAVPIYAAASALFRITVVQAAQWASAIALGLLTFGTFALARRVFSAIGAFVAAAIVLCSPFTLLLWSHETLLYLATIVVGANLYVLERRAGAALVLGLASLFRGEALLVLPFFWIAEQRRGGWRSALVFAGLSLVPFALWMALASWYFGTFLSATIASKHAQFFYPGIPSYLTGLVDFVIVLYAFTPSFAWGIGVAFACAVCCIAAVYCRLIPRAAVAVGVWVCATTALYLALRLPFYFWFASQFGIGMAVAAACAWPRAATIRPGPLLAFARAASLVLVAINAAFLCIGAAHRTFPAHGAVAGVMSNLHENAYKSLGLWFAQHAAPHDTISFAEFGQLRYYSGRDVVDYLGLVTPGAASQLANGNAIWTFKRYHPTWVVDSPPWQLFVSPTEYDWFRTAYGRVSELHFSGDPIRNDFIIYRLREPRAIPTPDVPDKTVLIGIPSATTSAFDIPFGLTRPGANEAEARVSALQTCAGIEISVADDHRTIARVHRSLGATTAERLSLSFAPLKRVGLYHMHIAGCNIQLAEARNPERSLIVYRPTQTDTRATAVSSSPDVTAVTGLHSGKCAPRRAQEISAALASLSAIDLAWKARCKCGFASYDDLVGAARLKDKVSAPGKIDFKDNVLTVTLATPYAFPAPKSVSLSTLTSELVLKAQPHTDQTVIWIGHRSERDGKQRFVAYKILDDRFNLGRPGNECGVRGT